MNILCRLVLLMGCLGELLAQEKPREALPQVNPEAGDFLKFPDDGGPWKHPDTDLRFPMKLGSYELKTGFKDKKAEAGTLLTYVHSKLNIKADIILAPCPRQITAVGGNIIPGVVEYLRGTARELRVAAESQGYKELEDKRGRIESGAIELWGIGPIPTVQVLSQFAPADPADADKLAAISQWLNLIIYQDSWIQTSLVMPISLGAEGEKEREAFLTQLVQTVRAPAVSTHLVGMCNEYLKDPLSKKSRETADSLLVYARENPALKITMPGEALTPALNELATYAEGTEKDALRGFIIGAGAKVFMGDPLDSQFEEGARVMALVYEKIKATNPNARSPALDELTKLSTEKKAADWLRRRMNAPLAQ